MVTLGQTNLTKFKFQIKRESKMLKKTNALLMVSLGGVIVTLSACSTMGTVIAHHDLQTKTQMSQR